MLFNTFMNSEKKKKKIIVMKIEEFIQIKMKNLYNYYIFKLSSKLSYFKHKNSLFNKLFIKLNLKLQLQIFSKIQQPN